MSYVVKLYGFSDPASAQRAVKGNTIAFPQDLKEVGKKLPDSNSLAHSIIKVVFIGDRTCPTEVQKAKKFLRVRREKVRTALVWLCDNHEGFKKLGITVNENELRNIPIDGVPKTLEENIVYSSNEDLNNREHSTYTSEATNRPPGSGSPEQNEPLILERSGIVDVDSTAVTEEEMYRGACRNLKKLTNTVIEIPRSNEPISVWTGQEYWTLGFPCLFPYGIGGFHTGLGYP